jgi:hypothetical protein
MPSANYDKPDSREYFMAVKRHSDLIGSNFAGQDLSGFDLHGANMTSSDFEGANLSGVNFSGCILTNCNFRGADMSKGNFTGAKMTKSDFSRANLHLADFTDADVVGSDFSISYMKSAKFLRTDARNCHFRGIMGKNAMFIYADLRKCSWSGAQLLGARFDGSKVWGARNAHRATFRWWMSPLGGPPSEEPRDGWDMLDQSIAGGVSVRENAAKPVKWNKKDTGIIDRILKWLERKNLEMRLN